jgi:hypothetical protein
MVTGDIVLAWQDGCLAATKIAEDLRFLVPLAR